MHTGDGEHWCRMDGGLGSGASMSLGSYGIVLNAGSVSWLQGLYFEQRVTQCVLRAP
jgi:hypothetical protein